MHFHGIHAARMDGIPGAGLIDPGGEFVYEFDAKPFGCHLYHCHALPLARHMHKGMYGLSSSILTRRAIRNTRSRPARGFSVRPKMPSGRN